jgi:2-methylcitrate dehydratase PrpD
LTHERLSHILYKLEKDKIVDALGHAFFQASGTGQLRRGVGSNFGGMRDAFCNKAGVFAAILSQIGIKGIEESFEGEAGLFNAYFGGKYNRDYLIKDLGAKFEGANVGYKPWPACVTTHGYIDAALLLMKENIINPEEIKEITVFVGDPLSQNLCSPLEGRRKPRTMLDAKFSIPFTVATAIAKQEVVIQSFTMDGIRDPEVLKVAQKIMPRKEIPLKDISGRIPRIVEIIMKNGKTYSKRIEIPYGHPERPLSWTDIVLKFKDCLKYSAETIPDKDRDRVIEMISNLENQDDVGKIAELLS